MLNFVWDSGRLRFPAFVLVFSTAYLEGRASRPPTGILPCARLAVSGHRRSRTPNLRDICWEKETRTVLFSVLLEICLGVVAPRRAFRDSLHLTVVVAFYSPRFDLSVLLMLPFCTDRLALRAAAIGLFEALGPAFLGGCLPLPLCLRRTTTSAFSAYCAVVGTRSLHIPLILLCWFLV